MHLHMNSLLFLRRQVRGLLALLPLVSVVALLVVLLVDPAGVAASWTLFQSPTATPTPARTNTPLPTPTSPTSTTFQSPVTTPHPLPPAHRFLHRPIRRRRCPAIHPSLPPPPHPCQPTRCQRRRLPPCQPTRCQQRRLPPRHRLRPIGHRPHRCRRAGPFRCPSCHLPLCPTRFHRRRCPRPTQNLFCLPSPWPGWLRPCSWPWPLLWGFFSAAC